MSKKSTRDALSDHDLRDLLHPYEASRFVLALIAGLVGTLIALLFVFASFGIGVLIIGFIILSVWFALSIFKAYLIGNSVRVSEDNFPDIYKLTEEIKQELGYDKRVDVYVSQGDLNALIYQFFRTRFIVLQSELVEGMRGEEGRAQLIWIISRFIGSLKVKHLRLNILRVIILSIEKVKIFNLLILPYERATQYSGDQIGLAVCQDVDSAITALQKFLVGNKLSAEVQAQGLVQQIGLSQSSFFGCLAQLLSTHPHTVNRYVNLLAFCRYKYPSIYARYMSRLAADDVRALEPLLPEYFPTGTSAADYAGPAVTTGAS